MIEASKNGDLDKVRSFGENISRQETCYCKRCLVTFLNSRNLRTFSVTRFVTFQVIAACIGKKYVSILTFLHVTDQRKFSPF